MVQEWAWRIGMFIFSVVPGIIGGGIVYHFIPRWSAVVIYEILLLFLLSWVLVEGTKRAPSESH